MSKSRPRTPPARYFAEHPIFTVEEFIASEPRRALDTVRSVLKYHTQQGQLVRIRRGLYRSEEFHDPWVVASRLAPDAVIAYGSALSLQRPWRPVPPWGSTAPITFLTATRPSVETDDEIAYVAVRPPRALGARWRAGVETLECSGISVSITPFERTLVDLLDRIDLAPPPLELWEAFAVGRPDPEPMVRHALALKSHLTAGRLGYFLELLPRTPSALLARLEQHRPGTPVYFDRARHDDLSHQVSRWNLIVPNVLNQTAEKTEFGRGPPRIPKFK